MLPARVALRILLVVALAFGLYARFKGLGTWPAEVDEYYILRSVQNVLASGLPAYDCGGYYVRGMLFQYLTAGLHLAGAPLELSSRLIAALSSLLALPAAYLLGSRLHSRTVGVLTVALLAISIWEVEMARFGRMYAPFQAVFLWYVVFFIRYTLDGERRALWAMLALTIIGALTWEGGVFIAALNLLPPFLRHDNGRVERADWRYLVGMAVLILPIAWFVTSDLRTLGPEPELPPGLADAPPIAATAVVGPLAPWATLAAHPIWLLAALIPAIAAAAALRWIWTFRERWLVALGLAAALGAALVHQFAAIPVILVLLLLMQLMHWREIVNRAAIPFGAALLLALVFWISFGLATTDWRGVPPPSSVASTLAALAHQLTRFPDFFNEIVRPWGGAIPILFIWLGLSVAVSAVRLIARPEESSRIERVLLILLVVLASAASASGPPRHETRYVFFLYPIALMIAVTVAVRAFEARQRIPVQWRTALGVVAALALFVVSEDFGIRHLARIDSPDVNFRVGIEGRLRSHLLHRADARGAAEWLSQHASPGTLVVNAYPSVDLYYPDFDYTFIDEHNQRFRAYACREGTMERWGNLPLLYTASALQSRLASGSRMIVVASRKETQGFQQRFAKWGPHLAWRSIDGDVEILDFPDPRQYAKNARVTADPHLN
jgi:hypothetical protein